MCACVTESLSCTAETDSAGRQLRLDKETPQSKGFGERLALGGPQYSACSYSASLSSSRPGAAASLKEQWAPRMRWRRKP